MAQRELNHYLQQVIQKKITINEDQAKTNVESMLYVANIFVELMKEVDPLFKAIYQKTIYTGSYFEGLKISDPSEFDLNLVLRLPFGAQDIQIEQSGLNAFIKYRLVQSASAISWSHPYQALKNHFDERGYLLRNKVSSWMQSVITRAFNQLNGGSTHNATYTVSLRESGPAVTMNVNSRRGSFDVDFVPVIEGPSANWPRGHHNSPRISQLTQSQRVWYLVPKGGKSQAIPDANTWIISMPEAEKALIHDKGCAKEVIRLLKGLKDAQRWPVISCAMKNLINVAIDENPSADFWHPINIGSVFKSMLRKLRNAIDQNRLPHYIYRDENLVSNLNVQERYNIVHKIDEILLDIDRFGPGTILQHFRV